jgi:hypothetical protein
MRAYFFCHSWLSGIQKGIQGAHAISSLVNVAGGGADFMKIYGEWATNHKTMIFLEGGNQDSLKDWHSFLAAQPHKVPSQKKPLAEQHYTMPFYIFHEDDESLNDCATAVVVLVSTKLCEAIDNYREMKRGEGLKSSEKNVNSVNSWLELREWEREFVEKISKCRLAV